MTSICTVESSINVIHQYWVWIIKTNLIFKYLSVDDIPWVPLLLRAFTFLWLIKLVVILCYVQYWDFKERVLVVIVVVLLYIVFVCYRRHQSFFLSRSAICAIYIPRVLNRFHFIEISSLHPVTHVPLQQWSEFPSIPLRDIAITYRSMLDFKAKRCLDY